jgi:hypothetical protein
MPGFGHRFHFVEKPPLMYSVALSLLFVNTILMLSLEFAGKYFFPRGVPETVHWYGENSITIQFVLVAFLATIVTIFRKRVHFVRRKEP